MIEIKNLVKSYGDLTVLKDVNLTVPKGMIYGIIGRSGSGKSTLLRCINGLESFQNGRVLVDNTDVQSLSALDLRHYRKGIGMIFQQFSLLSRLTVHENVALPLQCWKYDNNFITARVRTLLAMVGLANKADAFPRELSGGQKQRVAIARALTMSPKLLLCDEATSALDPQTAKSIIKLLNQINQELGITIIVVTHQMSVLRASCEQITILEDGKVAESGLIEQVFLQQPPALKRLIGEKDFVIPDEGRTIQVMLSSEHSDLPIITQMAQDLAINFLVLGGEMDKYRDQLLGSVIINMQEEHFTSVQHYLNSRQVLWNILLPQARGGANDE